MTISPEEYKALMIIFDDFSHFLENQKGMYTDACAGFAENKRLIEIQKARVQRPMMLRRGVDGRPVIMMTSLEDPESPDAIHFRIIRADRYIEENSRDGSHEQQHARAILVFIFTYWEEEIRPQMAKALNLKLDDIKSDVMGDLRIIRHAILHAKSIIKKEEHRRLKRLQEMFSLGEKIILTHEKMHKIFELINQDCMRFILKFTGTEGQLNPDEIKQFAIQRFDRNSS